MSEMNRRDALQHLLAVPAGMVIAPEVVERAAAHVEAALAPVAVEESGEAQGTQPAARPAYTPKQFTTDEWRLLRVLVDYVIPRDARSGSATDAGVPEFMDFMLGEYTSMRTWMKNGLGWMNAECRARFGKGFVSCTDAQRRVVLDAIAYPKKAAPEMKPGVDFFNNLRNLTASGFWSSRIGVRDLGYTGNVPVGRWEGMPPKVMAWLKRAT